MATQETIEHARVWVLSLIELVLNMRNLIGREPDEREQYQEAQAIRLLLALLELAEAVPGILQVESWWGGSMEPATLEEITTDLGQVFDTEVVDDPACRRAQHVAMRILGALNAVLAGRSIQVYLPSEEETREAQGYAAGVAEEAAAGETAVAQEGTDENGAPA